VRSEALGGIYRFRTDAGITTLIQLYDGIADLKIKAEILSNLLRRTGDNSRARTKLVAVAKTEKEEELRRIALGQLFRIKGDEGLNSLIEIYDSVADVKTKQRVIQYLGANKSRKAIDKLIAIAKSDADPVVRQSAIRTLYNIEQRLYLDLIDRGKVGTSSNLFEPVKPPGAVEGFSFKGQPIPIEGYLAPESSTPKPASFTKEKPRRKGGDQ
jgi:hypothetical protein